MIQQTVKPRSISAVSYSAPDSLLWKQHTFTKTELARGKMLLLDAQHPLPAELPPPNTFSIAVQGKGMIPVTSLKIQSGLETIQALQALFKALSEKGADGFCVQQGTLSPAQQKELRLAYLRKAMRFLPPKQAVEKTLQETDTPATGEMLQEFTVELCPRQMETGAPPLEHTQDGRILLQTAWRYGFIKTDTHGNDSSIWRFRYVGKAHATAMTFLNLSFEAYLQWLHEKGTLSITEGGQVRYLILCKPITGERVSFELPQNADFEASLDNQGYALVACTL